mmetsp:Transcript_15321/g.59919  ORF Transcript_15321/g.59919 Transcript_15321/m.59919 type:complete len:310 (+) Transcript_15321:379-1308(+)
MAARDVGSGLGRYMMMPIQLCRPGLDGSRPSFVAGESGDLDPALHRCSMGAGAGIPSRSIIASSSFMYARSAPVLLSTSSPVRNAISYTCCSPPQSNPRIWSLQSHRVPAFRRQNSASAALHRLTCSRSSGFTFSSSSRSCPNPMPVASTPGATSFSSFTIGSVFFASDLNALVGFGTFAFAASGLDPTTTTVSVCGIHMYRMCWCSLSHLSWFFQTSSCVAVHVRSRSRCAGTHRSVTSDATPRDPIAHRAIRNLSGSSSSSDRRISPSPGVTSARDVTVSSSGGIRAPVPCAPTWVNPPICCSRMDA